MSSGLSQNADTRYPDSNGKEVLSIALIGPDHARRKAVADAVGRCRGTEIREFSSYPAALDDVPRLLEQYFDIIIVDLDSEPEFAMELVESICSKDQAIVMVYSAMAQQDLVVRCMRAGVREYLTPPFEQEAVSEALTRGAALLRPGRKPARKSQGKLLVFMGAKGGSGVTTIACNFAIALAQESDQDTLLIDLALPMGDAALNLGIAAEFSTDNALQDADRLDASFLLKLVSKHQSGVSVLAAPSKVPEVAASPEAIDKLMAVARQEFDNVIVDVGSRIDLTGTTLFKEATTIYLVTQAGISELRNSNRLISRFFSEGRSNLEIVVNRFEASFLGVTEEVITKAISRPVRWKIPDDYDAARQMQNMATAVSLPDSPISRLILEMASSVTGIPISKEKKKGFSFKGLGRGNQDKPTTLDLLSEIRNSTPAHSGTKATITWTTPDPIIYGTALSAAQLNATASVDGTLAYTPGSGYVLPAGTHTLWVTFNAMDSNGNQPVQAAASIVVAKATPTITWPAPAEMTCGAALSAAQLNATASVAGSFCYSPDASEVLEAGTHTLTAAFTPADTANFNAAQTAVTVTVAKATPAIAWATPGEIPAGTPLSTLQLSATATVPGTFRYSPAAGDVLPTGTHTLSATFTADNSSGYAEAHATVTLTVAKATPALAWLKPDPITYGTMLSTTQLNASASVAGTFHYFPGDGAMLAAGEHTPSLTFTPADGRNYATARAAVSLTVARALPVIVWPAPDPITCGATLSASQLNATASIPGTFVYTPAAGESLPPGAHTLSVTFIPADTMNYATARATARLTAKEKLPTLITWPAPSAVPYGDALSDAQLNATASAPGMFTYAPAAGDVPAPGRHTLSVIFTPADEERYVTAQSTVTLVVERLPDIAALLATATETLPASATETLFATAAEMPIAPAVPANSTASEDAEPEAVTSSDNRTQEIQRETRTYKGAIYERGDDGQWHLQRK